jgi:hypothetical protein
MTSEHPDRDGLPDRPAAATVSPASLPLLAWQGSCARSTAGKAPSPACTSSPALGGIRPAALGWVSTGASTG